MKSLNRNLYVAARINDATREMKLYFQTKKSQTVDSYKLDEAYILAIISKSFIQIEGENSKPKH